MATLAQRPQGHREPMVRIQRPSAATRKKALARDLGPGVSSAWGARSCDISRFLVLALSASTEGTQGTSYICLTEHLAPPHRDQTAPKEERRLRLGGHEDTRQTQVIRGAGRLRGEEQGAEFSSRGKQTPPGHRKRGEGLPFQGRHPSWLLERGAIRHAVPSGPSDDTPVRTKYARWPRGAGQAGEAAASAG